MKTLFDFYKTKEGKWFIDLPEYQGAIQDLQMVEGADTMLDMLSDMENNVTLYVSDDVHPKTFHHVLKLIATGEHETEGAWYDFNGLRVWLCSVALFVFGYYPKIIYIKEI